MAANENIFASVLTLRHIICKLEREEQSGTGYIEKETIR